MNKIKKISSSILKKTVAFAMIFLVLVSAFGVDALADVISTVTNTDIEGGPFVKVSMIDMRHVSNINRDFAYPDTGYVKFTIDVVGLKEGERLENDITLSYRTFDITAVASENDYTRKSGDITFYADDDVTSYSIDVSVGTTEYAIIPFGSQNSFSTMQHTGGPNSQYMTSWGVPSSTVGYITRYFGFEIYNVEGAEVYHVAEKNGTNTYYDKAYGMIQAEHYLPVMKVLDYSKSDVFNYSYSYDFYYDKTHISDCKLVKNTNYERSYYDALSSDMGSAFYNDFVKTGMGHFYVTGYCRFCGSDLSQRDAYIGLGYDGYENAVNVNDAAKMNSMNMGIVCYEMDGYPVNAPVNFGAYRQETDDDIDMNSAYYDEYEWDEDSYQFAKYRTQCKIKLGWDDDRYLIYRRPIMSNAYQVEGLSTKFWITGRTFKYGSDRKAANCIIGVVYRDDVQPVIEKVIVEDTTYIQKTKDDNLRIMVRFSEPMQYDPSKGAYLVCKLNNQNAKTTYNFKYEEGFGTDTLVFSLPLSEVPDTAQITDIYVMSIVKADGICDFSGPSNIYTTDLKKDTENTGAYGTRDYSTENRRYTILDSYSKDGTTALVGPIQAKLETAVDPRQPTINKITNNNAGKSLSTHTATISLNVPQMNYTLYAHWTEDLNETENNEIPRPTYTDSDIVHKETGQGQGGAITSSTSTFTVSASLNGTVYLWVKIVSAFGNSAERLCGPFYFDNTPDEVSDIVALETNLSSPTKTKTIQFTVKHTKDYISCAGQELMSKDGQTIGFSQLNLLYSTSSQWGANADIKSVTLYSASLPNSRKLTCKVGNTDVDNVTTVVDYVYEYKCIIPSEKGVISTDQFIKKTNGVSVKKSYVTSRTYRIDIGYNPEKSINDFSLSDSTKYKKIYIGFVIYDANRNVKTYPSADFAAGTDYISNEFAFFDIRNIKTANISYKEQGDPAYDVLSQSVKNNSMLDSSVVALLPGKPLTISFGFDEESGIFKSDLDNSNYKVNINVVKPNSKVGVDESTLTNQAVELSDWGALIDGTYVGNKANDPSVEYATSWFSWRYSGAKDVKNGAGTTIDTVYTSLDLTTYLPSDTDDLYGYYEVFFTFTRDNPDPQEDEVIYTTSATFYLGSGEDETANSGAIDGGKLLINKVFRLSDDARYYYKNKNGNILSSSAYNALAFSDVEIAKDYLKYMELQDLYLWKIPNQETANSLNQGSGSYIRSAADQTAGREAKVGEYWIRYKSKNWTQSGAENTTAWIYYYYSDEANVANIDTANLPSALSEAINAVVNTIASTGYTMLLAGPDNLTVDGTPKLPDSAIRPKFEYTKETFSQTELLSNIYFSGDSGIYNASVLFDEEGETKSYSLSSNTSVSFGGNTHIYIAPYNTGVFGEVPTGKSVTLKGTVDEVYRQILRGDSNNKLSDEDIEAAVAESGRYVLLEIDENGIHYSNIYIDKTAPYLNFEYTIYTKTEDGNIGTVMANKNTTSSQDPDRLINAINFTIIGIGKNGSKTSANEEIDKEEIDRYAYVVVYNSTKTKMLYTMTVADLQLKSLKLTEEGTYYVDVWDRSGNYYEMTVNLVSKPMTVRVSTDNDVKITVTGRNAEQIQVYEVKLNNLPIDSSFGAIKTYSENGTYDIHIVDRFGITFDYSIAFSRQIPPITWRTNNAVSDQTIDETNSTYAKLVRQSSSEYNIVTSVPVSFRFSTSAGIVADFIDGASEDSFLKTVGVYTTYAQSEIGDFKVKLYYKDHPNVYVVYNVIVDTQSPVAELSYDYYSFEDMATLDGMRQLLAADSTFEIGDVVAPMRIDYMLLDKVTLYAASGASIFSSEARLKLSDASGISRMKIEKDGAVIYDGADLNGNGNFEDGYSYVFTDYGKYVITVFDNLSNRTVYTFTNNTSDDVVYTVDGVKFTPTYDYEYKLDSLGNPLMDEETGSPIVIGKWLYLLKFETVGNEEAAYAGIQSKNSVGYFVRNTQKCKDSWIKYGNKTQSVSISSDSNTQILLTYDKEIWNGMEYETVRYYKFLGVKLTGGNVTTYQYVYSLDEDTGFASLDEEESESSVLSVLGAAIDMKYQIFTFDEELGIYLTASFDKNGVLTLTVNASKDEGVIIKSEIKVTQSGGSYEPAYFQTYLSGYTSEVLVKNNNGNITEGEIGVGEWKYANGKGLTIDTDNVDEYLTAVLVSYSLTMTPTEYKYYYTATGEIDVKDLYKFDDKDGYYFIKTVNKFGNEKIYCIAISNNLLVSTVAEYSDGWKREYGSDDPVDVYANKSIVISFRSDKKIVYSIVNNATGEPYLPEIVTTASSVALVFTEEGTYTVAVSDGYNNKIVRTIGICEKSVSVPSDILTGWNDKALGKNENYTNKKLSVSSIIAEQRGIYYIAVEKNGKLTVILDKISGSDLRVNEDTEKLTQCIGTEGDGTYTVYFRDAYGNLTKTDVYYRETPTLSLSRSTKLSQNAENIVLPLPEDMTEDFLFISNNALYFDTVSSNYLFKIDGKVENCPKTLAFSNDITEAPPKNYVIEYVDEYGFSYKFTATLYRTVISLELDSSVDSTEKNGILMTNDPIRVVFSDAAECYYQKDGGEFEYLPRDGVLKKDGDYLIYAEDIAGNYAYFTITKDSAVQYSFREGKFGSKLENGFVTDSDRVVFTAENGDSATITSAFLNGEKVDGKDGYTFSKNGKWEIIVSDDAGNTSFFMFYVYTHAINKLNYYEPQDYEITDIWYSATGTGKVSFNSAIEVDGDGQRHFNFTKAGNYSVIMNSLLTGTAVTFEIEISEEMPTAQLIGVENGGATIENITIGSTKKNDTVTVYRDGSKTPYATYDIAFDGEKVQISEEGDYTVVVRNLAGNEISYSFTRKHVANTAGSVLIILLLVTIIIGLFAGMTYRNKSKVDK